MEKNTNKDGSTYEYTDRCIYLCNGKRPCNQKPFCSYNHSKRRAGEYCQFTFDPEYAINKMTRKTSTSYNEG